MKLTAQQYWHWRTCIAEMEAAKFEQKASELQYGQMLKDLEIARLNTALFKAVQLPTFEAKHSRAKLAYEECKRELEAELGVSLNNSVINDSFEIIKLEG